MNYISFVGFAGSGKSACGQYLTQHHGYHKIAFADALKDVCAAIFCWDRALLEGDTAESRTWRETVDQWWGKRLGLEGFTPRWALRNIGTEIMRRHFDTDIWAHNVERRIELTPYDCPGLVFVDARFSNEFDLLQRKRARTIRVRRGPEPPWYPLAVAAMSGDELAGSRLEFQERIHQSEWRWVGLPIDGVIENDSDLPTLYQRAEAWVPGLATVA